MAKSRREQPERVGSVEDLSWRLEGFQGKGRSRGPPPPPAALSQAEL